MIYICNNCGSSIKLIEGRGDSFFKLKCNKCSITLFSKVGPGFDVDFVYYQYIINESWYDLISSSNHTGDFELKTKILCPLGNNCLPEIFLAPNIVDNIILVKEFAERIIRLSILL